MPSTNLKWLNPKATPEPLSRFADAIACQLNDALKVATEQLIVVNIDFYCQFD